MPEAGTMSFTACKIKFISINPRFKKKYNASKLPKIYQKLKVSLFSTTNPLSIGNPVGKL